MLTTLSRLVLLSFRHRDSTEQTNKMTLRDSKKARKQENIKHLIITVYIFLGHVLKVR